MKKITTTLFLLTNLVLSSCSHSPISFLERNIAAEKKLKLMVVSATKKSMSENILTAKLAIDPRVKWYPIQSGTSASSYMVFPEEMEKEVSKALRDGNFKMISRTEILTSDLAEVESGKFSLKIVDYNPQSQLFGTTALEEASNFEAVLKSQEVPAGVKVLNAKDNSTISLLIPTDKLDEFKGKVEKQLPFRSSYNSLPYEQPLTLRIVNTGRSGFAEQSLTEHIAKDPRIQWFSVRSGTDYSHYMIYPSELDQSVAKAIRNGVKMKGHVTTTILPSEVREIESGKVVLKIISYNPESQHFGTTAMDDFSNFMSVVTGHDMPEGARFINASNNQAISALVDVNALPEFKRMIEKELPIRSVYESHPFDIRAFCIEQMKVFF